MSEKLTHRLPKLAALTLFGLLMIAAWSKLPTDFFQFTPNFYGILSLIAFGFNLALLVAVNRLKSDNQEIYWYKFFLLAIALWALTEALSRMAVVPEASIFWGNWSAPGWALSGAFFFGYTVYYTKNNQFLERLLNQLALYLPTILFVGLALSTDYIILRDVAGTVRTPWGFNVAPGPLFLFLLAWVEILFLVSLVMMINHYRKGFEPKLKKQALLNIIAILIPLVGSIISDGVPVVLRINHVVPLTILLISIQGAIIAYSKFKYSLFVINPLTLAPHILSEMNEMLLIVNHNQKIEYVNPRAEELLGLTEEQLTGRFVGDFFDQQKYGQFQKDVVTPLLQGLREVSSQNTEIITHTKKRLPVLISARSIQGTNAKDGGLILVITDLSNVIAVQQQNELLEDTKKAMLNALEDAQQLEQELRHEKANIEKTVTERTTQLNQEQTRLAASINSLNLGFLMTDSNDQLMTINPMAKKILGVSDDAEFSDVDKVLSQLVDLKAQIKKCITTKLAVEVKELSFGSRFLHLLIQPIIDQSSNVLGVVIVVEDITDELALQRSREEFFSIASHELRTPLTSIRGNTGLIKEYYMDQLKDPELKEMISDIHESSVRLIEIVNDFLDTSRLEQGRVEFKNKEFDLMQLMHDSIKEFQAGLADKKIYIKVVADEVVNVFADPDRVKQVIINLVGNAIKFTEQGGITLTLTKLDNLAKVFITDTGKGIPLESQHLLFRKFQQASNNILTRDSTKGTGLGLYITKLMVEGMGGNVVLEDSKENQGSTFSFTLPLAKAAVPMSETEVTKTTAGVS